MKEQLLSFLKIFFPFSIVLLALQYLLTTYVLDFEMFYHLWGIYLFFILSTGLIYAVLLYIQQNYPEKTGFAFMGFSLLKMLAALIFLFPLILSGIPSAFPNIMSFFIPYFLFLIFETIYVVKLINLE